uniref:SH3 domain and tetratricopeptide repeat-containing protein 1 isoform X1 n=1 Tax=Pogona vitticeps TaxID=103695 RepID=A0A6J0UQA6_9SAUR
MESSMATADEPPSKYVSECDVVKKVKMSHNFPSNLKQDEKTSCEENSELLRNSTSYSTSLPVNMRDPILPHVNKGITMQQQQKDLSLKITMVKCKTGLSDSHLQQYMRRRLCLLENDNQKARAVFSELSARLLSIHSEEQLIVITFWTFEEIWKFMTYYSLGFLNNCMENLLLDDHFWLSSLEEAIGINVQLDDKCLDMIYRSLLIQEAFFPQGTFFAFHPQNDVSEGRAVNDNREVRIHQWKKAAREGGQESSRWGDLAEDSSGALNAFHQWFLKANASPSDFTRKTEPVAHDQMATGYSVAIIRHESSVADEIGFEKGDGIEIIGYFTKCMPWFLGRHVPTGRLGFVQSSHVVLDGFHTTVTEIPSLAFFENEHSYFTQEVFFEENVIRLLTDTSNSNICNVYQIDEQDILECDNSAQQEMSPPFLNTNPRIIKYKVAQSLKEVRDFQLWKAERDDQKQKAATSTGVQASGNVEPRFCIYRDVKLCRPEMCDSLLAFLNSKTYKPSFKNLYDLSFSFLSILFYGYATEEELIDYFVWAREVAKRAGLPWALTRLCLLLGRMSVRKFKLSQARIYFEEALTAMQGDFSDLYLVVCLYTNLSGIYLKQNNKEKCSFLDKAASLLMGIPSYISSTDMESDILKYALKKAVMSQSQHAEARACFLLAKHYLNFKQGEEALPFLERLQLLKKSLTLQKDSLSADCYCKMGQLYSQKCLPHLALSCVKIAISCSSCTVFGSLKCIDLVFKNVGKVHSLKTVGQTHPSQIAYYLGQILHLLEASKEHPVLCSMVCYNLSLLHCHHKQYRRAIGYIEKILDRGAHKNAEETINHLIMLSWLYILSHQDSLALDILNTIVESSQSNHQQLGVVYNMTAIGLRRISHTKLAAESYYKALNISRETGKIHNQAVAVANIGILCLHSGARCLGEHFLIQAIKLLSELPSAEGGRNLIDVLLRLGCCYAEGVYKDKARCCYEWAFLVAIETNCLEGQLKAVQHLCQFYSTVLPDEAQCVIYNEYQLSLVRKMSNKVMEGQILETISQLYLSLGTERAYRSALEYTKRSLGIFIDLQAKAREAQAWLQAGKIYYILRQNELVDLYIQVAQNAARCIQDPNLEMELSEASGDIFFNGDWEREKAVPFYRDKALPLAVKMRNSHAELRLLNKLAELLFSLKSYEECLEYVQASLMLSINLGNHLNERLAYHRLAVIYRHLGQYELTEHFFLKALSLCPSPLEFDEEAVYYVKVYLVLGDITFHDLKDPFDAAGYYNLALAAAMDLGNKKAQLKIYTRLAVIYHNFLVDREMSLFYYQKARAFATELNIRRINLSPHQYMSASLAPMKNVA